MVQSKVLLFLCLLLASLGIGLLVREYVPRGSSQQLRSRPSGALVQPLRERKSADPKNDDSWHTDRSQLRLTPTQVEKYPVRLTRWGYSPALVPAPSPGVIQLQPRPWFLALLALPWLASGLSLTIFLRSRRLARDSQAQQVAEDGRNLEIGPGSVVGSYTIQELIGQGSQGEVYRAQDVDRNPVAVKVMSMQFTKDREFRTRFEREIDAGMRLQHPNLLPTLKWGIQDGRYWMAQPFLPNGTLAQRMARESLSEEESVKILLTLAQALDYAHQHKIIHRDIKPANILLNERKEAVLADFGVARTARYATITQQDVVLGTPAYMAPEQGRGERVTFRSDLYSIGVLAYEMVTGELPFRGDPIAVIIAHMSQPAPSAIAKKPELNPRLDFVISKLLKKEPKERFQSAAELVAALRIVEDSRRVPKP